MHFRLLSDISDAETIASGSGIREIARLRKRYGRGRWRKRKGTAEVQLPDGEIGLAEVHWYEATGSGVASSKSNASSEVKYYGEDSKAPRNLCG